MRGGVDVCAFVAPHWVICTRRLRVRAVASPRSQAPWFLAPPVSVMRAPHVHSQVKRPMCLVHGCSFGIPAPFTLALARPKLDRAACPCRATSAFSAREVRG